MTIKNNAGLHVSALYRFLLSVCTRCLQLNHHFCLVLWIMVSTHFCTHLEKTKRLMGKYSHLWKAMLHYDAAINTITWEGLEFFAMWPLIMGCFRCRTHSTPGKTSWPQLGRWLISPARYHRPVPRARIQSEVLGTSAWDFRNAAGLPHHLWAVCLRTLKLLH